MPAVKMKVPPSVAIDDNGKKRVQFFNIKLHVEDDGTVEAPRWLVPELLSRGCTRVDGQSEAMDMHAELARAEGHELSVFLQAHGHRDHSFEKNKHIHSDQLRALAQSGCPKCGHHVEIDGIDPVFHGKTENHDQQAPVKYKLMNVVADWLDSFHGRFHQKGQGRIVVMSHGEKLQKALALAAKHHPVKPGGPSA